jgi:hypothetical protein
MKSKLLILGVTALISLTSCQKDDSSEMLQSPNVKQSKSNPKATTAVPTPAGWGIHRKFYTSTKECAAPKESCFDDVIITPTKYADITTCLAGGATVVGTYFNGTSWHSFMPGLLDVANSDALSALQSGNYYLEEETNPTNGHKFVLVKDASVTDEQEPKYVFEFIIEDDVVVVE